MMNHELTLERPRAIGGPLLAVLQVAGLAAAIACGALLRIPLPFSPVPVTLQTLPVLMAAAAVGPYRATAGVLLYTGLGFAGVPLFAASGGATLGYLAGFALVPAVMARMERPLLSVLAGTAVIFACGAAWLSFYVGGLGPALLLGVAPFLPGALVKGMVAYKGILWFRRQQ